MIKKAFFLMVWILFGAFILNAQTPTKWRGENSNGIYNETGLFGIAIH